MEADTPYIYVFIRKDLSSAQRAVQTGHACYDAGKKFNLAWQPNTHLILMGFDNERKLLRAIDEIT